MSIERPHNLIEDFDILDPYAPQGITKINHHADALATISAGTFEERNGRKIPKRSQDGTIYISDPSNRAPELAKRLKATQGKHLTIAFLHNDPRQFIQQRFAKYGNPRIYGDTTQLTVIDKNSKKRDVYHAGTDGYQHWLKECKPQYNVYFVLAEWGQDNTPNILMPDGFGYYRLRTNSRNSIRNIVSFLHNLYGVTNNQVFGIPLNLSIIYQESVDANGINQRIPVWSLIMQPPGGIELSSRNFAQLTHGGFRAIQSMGAAALPAPTQETVEDFEREIEVLPVLEDDEGTQQNRLLQFQEIVAGTVLERCPDSVLKAAGFSASLEEVATNMTEGAWQTLTDKARELAQMGFWRRHAEVVKSLGFGSDKGAFLAFVRHLVGRELEDVNNLTLDEQYVLEGVFGTADAARLALHAYNEKQVQEVGSSQEDMTEQEQEDATEASQLRIRMFDVLGRSGIAPRNYYKLLNAFFNTNFSQEDDVEFGMNELSEHEMRKIIEAAGMVLDKSTDWKQFGVRVPPLVEPIPEGDSGRATLPDVN